MAAHGRSGEEVQLAAVVHFGRRHRHPGTILYGNHMHYEPEQLIGKSCIAITNLPPRAMMGIKFCGMLLSAVHHEGEEEKLRLLMVDPHISAGANLY